MDKETKMMVNAIVEEIWKMEKRINKRFEQINKRLDKIDTYLESMQHEIKKRKRLKEKWKEAFLYQYSKVI